MRRRQFKAYSLETTECCGMPTLQRARLCQTEVVVTTEIFKDKVRQSVVYKEVMVTANYSTQGESFVVDTMFLNDGFSNERVPVSFGPEADSSEVLVGRDVWLTFCIHPELDRKTRFDGLIDPDYFGLYADFTSEFLNVYSEKHLFGVSFARSIVVEDAMKQITEGYSVFPAQCVVLPSSVLGDSVNGDSLCSAVLMGSDYEIKADKELLNVRQHGIGISQIYGHGIAMLDLALAAWQNSKDTIVWKFYVVPTIPICKRLAHVLNCGVPREWIEFWCYCREDGYGAELLSPNSYNRSFGATILAFFSSNPNLVRDATTSGTNLLIFTDFSADCEILTLFAYNAGVRPIVVGKSISMSLASYDLPEKHKALSRDDCGVLLSGNQCLECGMLHNMGDSSDHNTQFCIEVINQRKLRALRGGILLDCCFRPRANEFRGSSWPVRHINIPHLAGRRSFAASLDRMSQLSRILFNSNLRLPTDTRYVHVTALGSSDYIYTPKVIEMIHEAAEKLGSHCFIILEHSKRIYEKGQEVRRRENVMFIGWQNNIIDLLSCADTYLCRGGNAGSICDAVAAEVPTILLPPEYIPRERSSLSEICEWQDDSRGLIPRQAAIETYRERTNVFGEIVSAMRERSVPVEMLILDPLYANTSAFISAIESAICHRSQIVEALNDCRTITVSEFLELLENLVTRRVELGDEGIYREIW